MQLSVVQAELAGSQQQVVELSQHLAAAEAARAALQEQLEHLDVKVCLVLTHDFTWRVLHCNQNAPDSRGG